MFLSMSTNPLEGDGPALPDTAGADRPNKADQAKADAGVIALDVAKGAVAGGVTGAAVGAVKGAVKTKTGRNVLIGAIAVPTAAVVLLVAMVFGAAQANTAVPAGRSAVAQAAAELSFADNTAELASIQNAASQAGVQWEVLAAIHKTMKDRSGDKGTGPFGIDLDKARGEISKSDAENLDKSAVFIAKKFAAASQGTIDTLPNPSLDAGYMDTRGTKDKNTLKPADTEDAQAARDEVRKQYRAAIEATPLTDGKSLSADIFDRAVAFTTGEASPCESDTVSVGSGSSTATAADLNAKKKQYAQAIIDRVASRGMPEKAAVIALATALQESGLQMYWNPHVPGSQELAHGGPEGGRDLLPPNVSYSVGLFQQQVNGNQFSWGTVQDAMDPSKSADMFLDRLLTIPGWQTMPVTVAAQSVQASAFPDAYADDEVTAKKMVADMPPGKGSYGTTTTAAPSSPAGQAPPASTGSCLTGGAGTGVAGKGDDYPFKNAEIDIPDPWSLLTRECVSFVAWRLNVQMGWKEGQEYPFTPAKLGTSLFGSAVDWKDSLGPKFRMDRTPKVGAVAWWDANVAFPSTTTGPYGHVAIVSAVKGDTIDVEEYNFGSNHMYNARTIPASDVSAYIHVADIK